MEASKVITYSLLAQIRNSGNFVNSSVEIFVPIVKYALYKLITQSGVYKGASITEISTWICQYFGLDFPPAVLEKILLKIGQEINTSEELKLQVYRDGSFWIKNYSFEEFNDIYETNRQQVELVQTMFKQFCDINDVKKDSYNTRKEYPKLDAIFNNCRQVVVDSGVLRSSKLTIKFVSNKSSTSDIILSWGSYSER